MYFLIFPIVFLLSPLDIVFPLDLGLHDNKQNLSCLIFFYFFISNPSITFRKTSAINVPCQSMFQNFSPKFWTINWHSCSQIKPHSLQINFNFFINIFFQLPIILICPPDMKTIFEWSSERVKTLPVQEPLTLISLMSLPLCLLPFWHVHSDVFFPPVHFLIFFISSLL